MRMGRPQLIATRPASIFLLVNGGRRFEWPRAVVGAESPRKHAGLPALRVPKRRKPEAGKEKNDAFNI
jgi:hypothetical protein